MSKIKSAPKDGLLKRKDGVNRPYDRVSIILNEWKMKSGLTQDQIAAESGAAVPTIRLVFSGRRAPSFELMKYLREKRGFDLNILVAGK